MIKVILAIAQKYSFEPSTPLTWGKFLDDVNPILEDVQKKQGLHLFKVIMDEKHPKSIMANQINATLKKAGINV